LYVTGTAPGTVPASGALLYGNLVVTVPGIVSAVPGSPVAGIAIDRSIILQRSCTLCNRELRPDRVSTCTARP
jgi:hypothetical protein